MRRLLAIAVVALGASGCLYRFGLPNGRLPGGLTAVRVPLALNRTAEPNVEALLTNDVRRDLSAAGTYDENAQATLELTVVGVTNAPFLAGNGRPPAYKLTLGVQVRVLAADGKVVSQFVSTQAEEFTSGADTVLTEANRGAGVERVADAVSRDIVEKLSN